VRRRFAGLRLAVVALLALGCAPRLEALEVVALTEPPLGGRADADGIVLAQGTAIAVRLVGYTEDPFDYALRCGVTAVSTVSTCVGGPDRVEAWSLRAGLEGEAAALYPVDDGVFVVDAGKPGIANLVVTSTEATGELRAGVRVEAQP
jgi:hypothetical protein